MDTSPTLALPHALVVLLARTASMAAILPTRPIASRDTTVALASRRVLLVNQVPQS